MALLFVNGRSDRYDSIIDSFGPLDSSYEYIKVIRKLAAVIYASIFNKQPANLRMYSLIT